jgi:hypothetical protein
MYINVNCKFNDRGAWCKHKLVKRSLFGFGARCCILFPDNLLGKCELQEKCMKPIAPPPPPLPRKVRV